MIRILYFNSFYGGDIHNDTLGLPLKLNHDVHTYFFTLINLILKTMNIHLVC